MQAADNRSKVRVDCLEDADAGVEVAAEGDPCGTFSDFFTPSYQILASFLTLVPPVASTEDVYFVHGTVANLLNYG